MNSHIFDYTGEQTPEKYIRTMRKLVAHVGLMTEFRQPLQVQSHLEMPGILVQLVHIQRT